MKEDQRHFAGELELILVSRQLERVDHATNIAEDVIFMVEGRDVRHRSGGPARVERRSHLVRHLEG
jgi:phosphate transport system protein